MSTINALLSQFSERLHGIDRVKLLKMKLFLETRISSIKEANKIRVQQIGSMVRNNTYTLENIREIIQTKKILNEVNLELELRNLTNSSKAEGNVTNYTKVLHNATRNAVVHNTDQDFISLLKTLESQVNNEGSGKKRRSTRKRRNSRKS